MKFKIGDRVQINHTFTAKGFIPTGSYGYIESVNNWKNVYNIKIDGVDSILECHIDYLLNLEPYIDETKIILNWLEMR